MVSVGRVDKISRVLAFVVAMAFAGAAWAGPPWATDMPSFQSSYLQASDLPAPSDPSGDWAQQGCDGIAAQNGCTHSGKKLWTAKDMNAPVWQVHDIRYVFPDPAAAQRFMQQGVAELSEGLPPVSQPPMVGSEPQMFTAQGDHYGMGVEVFMYDLVFRVDNVVVKIFVAQGPTVKGKVLSPLMVAALGQKAVDRIRAAQPSQAPVAVAAPTPTPAPMQVATEPPPPTPEPTITPPPEPTPEPTPEPRRRGRLGSDIKDYWRSGIRKPYLFIGGDYSRAIGKFKLPGGTELTDKNGLDVALGMLFHPRGYFQFMFHREVWQVPKQQEQLVRRLEFILGVDLLALPPKWRVRPALMAMAGFGLGFGRVDSLASSTPDPLDPTSIVPVEEKRAIGVGGLLGADFALHVRVTEGFEFAPYAGVMLPAYTYTNDFLAGERHIDGERGFGRAVRWHVGLKLGFGGR